MVRDILTNPSLDTHPIVVTDRIRPCAMDLCVEKGHKSHPICQSFCISSSFYAHVYGLGSMDGTQEQSFGLIMHSIAPNRTSTAYSSPYSSNYSMAYSRAAKNDLSPTAGSISSVNSTSKRASSSPSNLVNGFAMNSVNSNYNISFGKTSNPKIQAMRDQMLVTGVFASHTSTNVSQGYSNPHGYPSRPLLNPSPIILRNIVSSTGNPMSNDQTAKDSLSSMLPMPFKSGLSENNHSYSNSVIAQNSVTKLGQLVVKNETYLNSFTTAQKESSTSQSTNIVSYMCISS